MTQDREQDALHHRLDEILHALLRQRDDAHEP